MSGITITIDESAAQQAKDAAAALMIILNELRESDFSLLSEKLERGGYQGTAAGIVQLIQDKLVDSKIVNKVTTSSVTPASELGNVHAFVGPGTYSNWGGVVVTAQNIGLISRVGGSYGVSLMPFDLGSYLKTVDLPNTDSIKLQEKTVEGRKFNSVRGGVNVIGTQESFSIVNFKKIVGTANSTVMGVYYKIDYNSLSDLNKIFNLEIIKNSGTSLNETRILKTEGDWSPTNYPISTGLVYTNGAGKTALNIFDRINASTDQAAKDYYATAKVLYVMLAYYNTGDVTNITFDNTIKFYEKFDKGLVVASEVTDTLKAKIIQESLTAANLPSYIKATDVLNLDFIKYQEKTSEGKKFNSTRGGTNIIGTQQTFSAANFKKVVGTVTTAVMGIYYKIEYANLAELNKNFTIDIIKNSGASLTEFKILKIEADWNPANFPITPGLPLVNGSGKIVLNIFEKIAASTDQPTKDYYATANVLYVMLAYYNTGDVTNITFDNTIKFYEKIEKGLSIASEITETLRAEIITASSASSLLYTDARVAEITPLVAIPFANIVSRDKTGFTTITQTGKYSFNFTKVAGQSTDYANGVYVKFIYNNLSELNKALTVALKNNGGSTLNTIKILRGVGDWGPGNYDINISLVEGSSNTINLYGLIMAASQDRIDYYNSVKVLYFNLVYYKNSVTAETAPITLNYDVTLAIENPAATNVATGLTSSAMAVVKTEIEKTLSIKKLGIIFWGDSLTAGGGWTTILGLLSGQAIYNGGTGGENALTILARQGGDAMIVSNKTIPATATAVILYDRAVDGSIKTQMGNLATPLLQGGTTHINPVMLSGVEGNLAWTGSSYSDMTGKWTFTRLIAGSEIIIKRPSAIRTAYDRLRNNNYLGVIYSGQNGGYTSNSELIKFHKWMIVHSTNQYTIIIGLSSGSAASRLDYETTFKAEFGRYFISLREYLANPIYAADGTTIVSCYGLDDAGLTATQADLNAIATGTVPPQLLADSVHYTESTKTVIGNYLYKKCVELNIF